MPAAMAASAILMLGTALGWSLHSGWAPDWGRKPDLVAFSSGGLLAQGAFRQLLETASSDTPITAQAENGESWELKTSFTFRSTGQLPCRRYEARNAATGQFAGYACRSGDGQWWIEAHTKLASTANSSKGFAPAGDDGDAALDAAIRIVMDGDVYRSQEERELIANGWRAITK
jgi:hypothetical protein